MTTWHGRHVPHDALWRLAKYHLAVLQDKQARGVRQGIAYDGTSAIIAMAFAVEALLNFVGEQKLKSAWKEGASYPQKIKDLEARLVFKYEKSLEPYLTLESLRRARKLLAHGKATTFLLGNASEDDVAAALQPEWSQYTSPADVLATAQQVDEFKNFILKRARIKPGTLFSSAWAEGE